MGLGSEPSALATQILSLPPLSDIKTICLPSGEYLACVSHAIPGMMFLASPPEKGTTYRSPNMSINISFPSGDISTLIHVASSVSNSTHRSGFNGSLYFSGCSNSLLSLSLNEANKDTGNKIINVNAETANNFPNKEYVIAFS